MLLHFFAVDLRMSYFSFDNRLITHTCHACNGHASRQDRTGKYCSSTLSVRSANSRIYRGYSTDHSKQQQV